MTKKGIKSLCNTCILFLLFVRITGEKDYYTGGVYEIFQYQDPSASTSELIKRNLEKYALAAKVAATHQVDMMVFPEEGLLPDVLPGDVSDVSEDVPNPKEENVIPCDEIDKFQNSSVLRNLSCLAKEHNFYLVADLIDAKTCEVKRKCNKFNVDYCRTNKKDCPESGKFYFNTLVAFNRTGNLIARYYKRHLYFEEGISTPKDPVNVYFTTDFGVKFTGDICFDLFFQESVEGADRPDVTALSYPTWWYDHTPLSYFATPYQQAWSITNKVNILAANVHYPREGSLGSGIYSALQGAVVYTHNPDGRSKLLIANVPKSATKIPQNFSFNTTFYYIDDGNVTQLKGEEPRDFKSECGYNVLGNASDDSLIDYRCHQTEVHQYTFVKLNETKDNIRVCSNKFCCRLNYAARSMNETFYFGVSGNRLNFYGTYLLGIQSCFVARCEPIEGKPCRNFLLKSETIFETVEIDGSFETDHVYPFAINSEIRLADKDEWNFDGISNMKYQNKKGKPLLYIGLDGRLYRKDKKLSGAN